MLKADFKRAFYARYFISSIVLILLIMFISSVGFMNEDSGAIDLLIFAMGGSGSTIFILCIAPILSYGMSYAVDVENKTPPFWLIRTGVRAYATSRFIVSVVMGFLSVGISIILFTWLSSLFFPVFNQVISADSYALLLENNQPYLYIIVVAVHYALSGALFAGCAIMISTYIPDKFSVIVIPVVVYFVLIRVTFVSSIPEYLKVSTLVDGIYPNVDPLAAFLYKLISVMVILFILLFMTIKKINRRMDTT